MSELWRRLRVLFRPGRFHSDLEEEMQSHLEMQAEENRENGMDADEARYAARRRFGNATLLRERSRDMWQWASLDQLTQDLGYAFRTMRRSPGFTAVVVLTLALGIGANTAIFSLVNAVLLRSLPVERPEELVRIEVRTERGKRTAFSFPFYENLRDRNQALSGLFARQPVSLSLSDGSHTERVIGELVTGNYFGVLGVGAAAGRLIGLEDDRQRDGHPVCVLSYDYWQRQFGGDPSVIGRTLLLNGRGFTIIGVSERAFSGTEPGYIPDIRLPMSMHRQATLSKQDVLSDRRNRWTQMIGRLKPEVSFEQARAALEVTVNQISSEYNDTPEGGRVTLLSARQGFGFLRARFEQPLLILMAVVGLVLLIACANLANLLLARSSARRKEIAVRLAVGASRSRIVRQLLMESLALALSGGAIGAIAAVWTVKGLLRLAPKPFFNRLELGIAPDWRVFGFAFIVAVAAAIIFGLAPAIQSTRVELTSALKEAAGRAAGRLAFRKALVVVQVGVSLVLLVAAGLFLGTLRRLRALDPGFHPEHVLLMSLNPRLNGYSDTATGAFYDRLMERAAALPGVRSASLAQSAPLSNSFWMTDFSTGDYRPKPGETMAVYRNVVGPDYFKTLQIPVLLGREFVRADAGQAPRVAIVSEALARRFWPDQNPVGKRVAFSTGGDVRYNVEVVGVVRDTKYYSMREEPRQIAYTPLAQGQPGGATLLVRTANDPRRAITALRAEIAALDRNLPVFDVTTLAAQVDDSLAIERLMAALSGCFSVLALVLAGVGLYGVVAFSVRRRTQEIGVRIALGAGRGDILRLVLRETATMAALGLAAGLATAAILTRIIAGLLFGVMERDPGVFAGMALLLALVALLAGWLPARRAARIAPTEALRYE